ncbi:MAG TPA: hypothetical protein PKH10_05495 [bacterium]|nr:hypothetical protein [bacterium]
MTASRAVFFLFALSFLLSCASVPDTHQVLFPRGELPEKRLTLLAPVLLNELKGVEDPSEVYDRNLYVGLIRFSGGFIEDVGRGMMARSRELRFSHQNRFSLVIRESFAGMVRNILDARGTPYNLSDADPTPLLAVTERSLIDRYPEEGHDNTNLPRIAYDIVPRTPFPADAALTGRLVVLPVVEFYYGHNGGWFNGQTFGCPAGIRFRVHVLIVDGDSGEMFYRFSDEERYLVPKQYRMNIIEIEQYLLDARRALFDKLLRHFP